MPASKSIPASKSTPPSKSIPRRSQPALESIRAEVGTGVDPIPASIIERAPSAELRDDQTDQDSLPPYELLDRILHGYVELNRGREQLDRRRIAARRRGASDATGGPCRVQAPPGPAGHQDHRAGFRTRPAHADHQRLPRLSRSHAARLPRVNAHRLRTTVAAPRGASVRIALPACVLACALSR